MVTKENTIIIDALREATDILRNNGVNDPELDAQVLMGYALGIERMELYLKFRENVSEDKLKLYKTLIKRRAQRIPVSYLTGEKEFMGLSFSVSEDVLIPRPETELLVEAVIHKIIGRSVLASTNSSGGIKRSEDEISLLDIGTGCGNIAVSLAKFIPSSRVFAVDISDKALDIARKNARRHGVDGKITFLKGDLFNPLEKVVSYGSIDCIVSNPPYIKRDVIDTLQAEVRREPRLALDGDTDGLSFYRAIAKKSGDYLISGGYLLMEMPAEDGYAIDDIIKKSGSFRSVEIINDYSQIQRIMIAERA
ncbi:MAG: peptide chain release factor N(5)-glutamine methyltransferase [bacterium]